MSDAKIFKLTDKVSLDSLGLAVENYLRDKKKMVVEGTKTNEGYFIQAKTEDGWKKFVGMDSALQVQMLDMNNETVNVQIGAAKWADKALAAGAGAALFAPLMGTAAYGAWLQSKLPNELFEFIEQYILSDGRTATVSLTTDVGIAKDSAICKKCGTHNSPDARFCTGCGEGLMDTCPGCNSSIPQNTKFCPECGLNVEEANVVVCVSCGDELPEGAKFCLNCGTKVEEEVDEPKGCISCGDELPEGAKFCLNCGTKVENNTGDE